MKLCKVYANAGTISHFLFGGSFEDCLFFCNNNDWVYDWNGGLVWELSIDETDEEIRESSLVIVYNDNIDGSFSESNLDDYYFEPNYAEQSYDNY